jgi:hypothetical protein
MNRRHHFLIPVIWTLLALLAPAWADNKSAAIDEMEGYLEFVEYGGGVIFAEQIPIGMMFKTPHPV